MGGSREDVVAEPQLFQVSQALELSAVHDLHRERVQSKVVVHGVIENLCMPDS